MPRESHVSQHERNVPMHVQKRICWRRSGVCCRHSLQPGERQTADLNDRRRSWWRSAFNHCFDSVLLLCKKAKERGERGKYRKNGIYAFSIWKWLGKLWRLRRRVRLKQENKHDSNSVAPCSIFVLRNWLYKSKYLFITVFFTGNMWFS